MARLPRKCSPSPLGERCPAGRGVLAALSHLPYSWDSCMGCKAAAAKITFNPQFGINPVERAGKGVSHSQDSENPSASGDLLVPAPAVAWGCLRMFLDLKDNVSSCCGGHGSFRFHQAEPHLGLLSPQTKNNAPGSRLRQGGSGVGWWLPRWQVAAGWNSGGPAAGQFYLSGFCPVRFWPSIWSQLLRTSPVVGPGVPL